MSFSKSAHSIAIEHSIIVRYSNDPSDWPDVHEREHLSKLDLNKSIANINGHLKWCRDGNFAFSSDNISVDEDGVLSAKCKTTDNVKALWSLIDLNDRIANVDGVLVDTSM
ncbi:hypothetical protein HDV00_012094 [Rhizophlyctis rosea]|nr:hypothetical protein HDV00_012094 [Rhizophlyctis rosea]